VVRVRERAARAACVKRERCGASGMRRCTPDARRQGSCVPHHHVRVASALPRGQHGPTVLRAGAHRSMSQGCACGPGCGCGPVCDCSPRLADMAKAVIESSCPLSSRWGTCAAETDTGTRETTCVWLCGARRSLAGVPVTRCTGRTSCLAAFVTHDHSGAANLGHSIGPRRVGHALSRSQHSATAAGQGEAD
jgi:hypothetical protein